MSSRTSYRRAAAGNAAAVAEFENDCHALAVYEPPRKERRKAAKKPRKAKAKSTFDLTLPSAREAISALPTIRKDFELEVLEMLSGYFHKKSNVAVSLGALAPADRTWYEAVMGDAALKALPFYDSSKGTKLSTFIISAVENFLVDENRKLKRQKRKAVLTPITTMEIVEAQERGMISEEAIEDRSKGGWERVYFEMDLKDFMASLTDTEKYLLSLRLDYGMSFEEIAEIRGMATNTWKRHEWLPVQQKAIKFGFEGKVICK